MKPNKFQALLEYTKTHLNRKRCRTILIAMACVVVFGTTYALILPAITVTPDLICDIPEHEHTADCYKMELVCDDDDPDHEHDDSCYEEVLVCGEEEHQHNEDCYAFPEKEPLEPDEAELVELTGDWAEDVVAVAESQADSQDSTDYDGWYTENTGADEDELDTSAPFVAFCLGSAEVDEDALPQAGSADEWLDALEEQDLLESDDTAAPGDLLFYVDEKDENRVGIVTDVDEKGEDTTYTVLGSDANGEVSESEHQAGDDSVLGFASIPQNPDETDSGTETSSEPAQPDADEDKNQPDADTGDKDGQDADTADDTDKNEQDTDSASEAPKAPAGDSEDQSADVSVGALSAADEDKTLQVTVEMDPSAESEELGSTPENPCYQTGDDALGTITVTTAEEAEPAEDGDTVARVYLAFENNTGTTELPGEYTVKSEEGDKYTYLVEQIGDSDTYYFEIPAPDPGDSLSIPFAARYLVSTEQGGDANLWCTITNAVEATLDMPNMVQTLSWMPYAANPYGIPAGNYGPYTLGYNSTRNAFTADPKYSKYIVKTSPFGLAGSFHVVAFDFLSMESHCNGNVLANTVIRSRDFGTRNYQDELSYIVNYNAVNSGSGSMDNHILVVGSNNNITKHDNGSTLGVNGTKVDRPKNIIQDIDSRNTPFIDLDEVKQEIKSISEWMGSQPNNGVIEDMRDTNNASLSIPNPDGAYYLNITPRYLTEKGIVGRDLKMKGFQPGHDGSLIVNVDCSGYGGQTITLPNKVTMFIGEKEHTFAEVVEFSNGKIIWNFINADGVTIDVNLMAGSVIAPGATVVAKMNLDGTIVADRVYIKGETHRTDFTGTIIPANADFKFTKQVDGETPDRSQRFSFVLEEWTGSTWRERQTTTNLENNVVFAPIKYENYWQDAGTHWYRVRELPNGVEGYRYDRTCYYIKVDVAQQWGTLKANYTYYSAPTKQDGAPFDANAGLSQVQKSQLVFNNRTDSGAHELPCTGGVGEWTIPTIGILCMAGMLAVTKQRPQRKEDE